MDIMASDSYSGCSNRNGGQKGKKNEKATVVKEKNSFGGAKIAKGRDGARIGETNICEGVCSKHVWSHPTSNVRFVRNNRNDILTVVSNGLFVSIQITVIDM